LYHQGTFLSEWAQSPLPPSQGKLPPPPERFIAAKPHPDQQGSLPPSLKPPVHLDKNSDLEGSPSYHRLDYMVVRSKSFDLARPVRHVCRTTHPTRRFPLSDLSSCCCFSPLGPVRPRSDSQAESRIKFLVRQATLSKSSEISADILLPRGRIARHQQIFVGLLVGQKPQN
jgi:hypothetical protein